jgi:hypothetical protein
VDRLKLADAVAAQLARLIVQGEYDRAVPLERDAAGLAACRVAPSVAAELSRILALSANPEISDDEPSTSMLNCIERSSVPDQILAANQWADAGAGVLHIIKNFTGEVINFEMAAELAEDDAPIEIRLWSSTTTSPSRIFPGPLATAG